jgi:hypothetical protein
MLGCSCCRTGADSGLARPERIETRKRAICASLKESYGFPDITFEVRGPLPIAQVEQESVERMGYSARTDVSAVAFGFQHARWVELKGKYAPGDKLYYFTSDERSWRHLFGIEGYVLARDDEIVDTIVTRMN